jgi:hypothetical protein
VIQLYQRSYIVSDVSRRGKDILLLLEDPGELLLKILLHHLKRRSLFRNKRCIVFSLLETKFGIDNLLLLDLEILIQVI